VTVETKVTPEFLGKPENGRRDMGAFTKLMNVVARTTCAFLPGLAKPDDDFARQYLDGPEYILYAKMDVRDRDHACQVTKTLLEAYPEASPELVRSALLHDVGKSSSRYRPLHRIAVHLYTPENIPASPRYHGLKGAWQRHRHHSQYGADLIRRHGGSERVAELVAKHHDPRGDSEAALLKRVDELY
jgi:putative nucleotidyltransferase with HDIG domain